MFVLDLVSDGLHKVGFSNANSAIKHQRVKRGNSWFLCDSQSSRTRQAVTITFHEIFETNDVGLSLELTV